MVDTNRKNYATVQAEDGVNYRDMADMMTDMGYPMNHSSARNYVLRVMRKFVKSIAASNSIELSEDSIDEVAKSPLFQSGISQILHDIHSLNESDERHI